MEIVKSLVNFISVLRFLFNDRIVFLTELVENLIYGFRGLAGIISNPGRRLGLVLVHSHLSQPAQFLPLSTFRIYN